MDEGVPLTQRREGDDSPFLTADDLRRGDERPRQEWSSLGENRQVAGSMMSADEPLSSSIRAAQFERERAKPFFSRA